MIRGQRARLMGGEYTYRLVADVRHWVSENGSPSLLTRPLVGAADDAVMEAVYDYWLLTTR